MIDETIGVPRWWMRVKPDIATFQAPWELEQLLGLFRWMQPERVLEVGCYEGGTLWHWLQRPGTTVVAVDDEMRNSEDWNDWADEAGSTLHRVWSRSNDQYAVEMVQSLAPYDFVFIDADHSYEGVLADWVNYREMVAAGGAIAFHDILPRPGYGVSYVWAEVKEIEGVRWIEICENAVQPGNEGRCGIGVAWLP